MALDFQHVPIGFSKGLNRSDLYLVSPGEQTSLVDCVFDDAETIARRPGFSALAGLGSTPLRLARNGANVLFESAFGLYCVSPSAGSSMEVKTLGDTTPASGGHAAYGQFLRASVQTSAIGDLGDPTSLGTATQVRSFDCAGTTNTAGQVIAAFAWNEVNGGGRHRVRVRVVDDASQAVILDKTYDPAAGQDFVNPRVVASDQRIWIFWNEPTSTQTIIGDMLNVDTLAFNGSGTLGVNSTGNGFDATIDVVNRMAVLAFRDSVTTFMQFTWFDRSLVQQQSVQKAITIPTTNISVCYVGSGKIIANYGIGTGLVKAVSCTFAGTTQAEATVSTPPDGAVAAGLGRVASYFDTTTSQYVVMYDYSASTVFTVPTYNNFSKIVFVRASKTTMGALDQANFVSQALIHGNPFNGVGAIGANVGFLLPVFYPSVTEPSVYVLSVIFPSSGTPVAENPRVVARIAWGEAGGETEGWTKFSRVKNNYAVSSTKTTFSFSRWGSQVAAYGATLMTSASVCRAEIDTSTQALGYAEQNGVTILAGACPQNFDGATTVEAGFHQPPVVTFVQAAGPGGNMAAGTHYFCATYGFKDARGNWHESEHSPIVAVAGFSAADKFACAASAPALSAHPNVQVIAYCSPASSASVLYRIGPVDVTGASASNGLSDANLVLGTQLPTTGGVLANEPLPPCRVIVEHQNRLFFLGGDDGYDVFFSHERSDGFAPEFSTLLKRRVPTSWGRVVSGASIDDKLVLICENRIGIIYGTGPSRTGANDSYSQPIEVASGYGGVWAAPLSVVRTDDGVWFQAAMGIRLLGRDLSITKTQAANDFGSAVDNLLASATIIRALIGTSKQQVRFYTTAGTVFVFDTLWSQWSTFSNHACTDAMLANGIFYHASSAGIIYKTDPLNPDVDDAGTAITGSVETAWLAVAGLQGFQRVTRALLLGQGLSNSVAETVNQSMTFSAAFDYENAYTVQTASNPFTLAPFETSTNQANRFQCEVQLTRQKCESVRFKITFKNATASNKTRFRLTSLALQVGLKKGRFKTSQSSRV